MLGIYYPYRGHGWKAKAIAVMWLSLFDLKKKLGIGFWSPNFRLFGRAYGVSFDGSFFIGYRWGTQHDTGVALDLGWVSVYTKRYERP